MKAYYTSENRSDDVIQDHLDVEFESYETSKIVLITGDRIETHALAVKAFLDHKHIIHYFAGSRSKYLATYDDYLRHCITILSDEQWVESKRAGRVVKKICKAINKKPNIKIVGSNYLKDFTLDFSKVPEEPYNLVLYNPCTKIKEIFIGPNPDEQYATLPHDQYLALIKECEHLYTNSSSGIYEAPFLINKKKIIWLGKRNYKRNYKI